MIDEKTIRDEIEARLDNIIEDFDAEADREELIDRLTEENDEAWGDLVRHNRLDQYTVDDMVETADECATIIKFAQEHAWVEDDHGLWEGLKYGVLASIAYNSLRNCFYQMLCDRGIDSNDDLPFSDD